MCCDPNLNSYSLYQNRKVFHYTLSLTQIISMEWFLICISQFSLYYYQMYKKETCHAFYLIIFVLHFLLFFNSSNITLPLITLITTPTTKCFQHISYESLLRKMQVTAGWICCMPCVWLRTSATVHKIALTTATLLVTSLLVASPVLFLLSTAPSQLPKDCNIKSDANCVTRSSPNTDCTTITCRQAMLSIQARTNWKIDPCQDFKGFSCSRNNAKTVKSIQEGVDTLMQRKLQNFMREQKLINSHLRTRQQKK